MDLDRFRRRCSALSAAVLIGLLLSNQAPAQGFYQGEAFDRRVPGELAALCGRGEPLDDRVG